MNNDINSMIVPRGLPKTIEEATRRYLHIYRSKYRGPAAELDRLASLAESKIYKLRRKAPTFFEEKLPTMVNQAASELLTWRTFVQSEATKFHATHRHFLRILDELTRSQPAGEISFQAEKDRSLHRDKLIQQQIQLRKRLDELDAKTYSYNELGYDDTDSEYCRDIREADRIRTELVKLSNSIARMECLDIEEEVTFVLRIQESTILKRLSPEQLSTLENLMLQFVKSHKNNKNAVMEISVIDDMIRQLHIDESKFTKEELSDLARDALDAYKSYFREIEHKRINERMDHLLKNKNLRPKEGLILADPDDITPELRQEFDQRARQYVRNFDDYLESMSQRQIVEGDDGDERLANDSDESDDEQSWEGSKKDEDEDEDDVDMVALSAAYVRVKEEPRDDYDDDAPSDSEILVNNETAMCMQDEVEFVESESNSSGEEESGNDPTSPGSDQDHVEHGTNVARQDPLGSGIKRDEPDADDSDDDIELIGVVEPCSKIKTLKLD